MIHVITLFSGYDSQCLALDRLGIEYELVGWSEIDKNAIKAHDALFPEYASRNLGDVSKADWSAIKEPIDLITYSSPCQDFSAAGLQRGGEKGSGTRSSLLWECERAIVAKRPKYLLMENVAALVSQKFIKTFQSWMALLERYGYRNYAQVLNAKDYGVPQNRERIFLVSVREDCEPNPYYFPKPQKLTRLMKDVLEQNVDEKYYLSNVMIDNVFADCKGFKRLDEAIRKELKVNRCWQKIWLDCFMGRTSHTEIAPTITTRTSSDNNNYIMERNEPKNFRIRKLTPRECFRLMDVDDKDIDKIQAAGISDSQQYKLAGNSIAVNVLTEIFRKLLIDTLPDDRQMRMF